MNEDNITISAGYMGIGFLKDIALMNQTYELPAIPNVVAMAKRLEDFKIIIGKEFKELDDVIAKLDELLNKEETQDFQLVYLEVVVMLADLLGDIIVYCASEAERYKIPLPAVELAIMASNFTKLGADGKPIKDENGKFLKGPNFRPPEPAIENILRAHWGMPTLAINYQETTQESPAPDPV